MPCPRQPPVARALLGLILTAACAHRPPAPPARLLPAEEASLADLRQLTFGGENAEAYWSWDGTQLSFQARRQTEGCDRIYRMSVGEHGAGTPVPISSGKGATTCAHFLPS